MTDNIIWLVLMACCITKAIHTYSEYVILIAFALKKWLQERTSLLRFYAHRLSWSELPPHPLPSTDKCHCRCMYLPFVCSNCTVSEAAHGTCCTDCIHIVSCLVSWAAFYRLVHFREIHCFGVTSCRPIWMRNIGNTLPSLHFHFFFLGRGNFFF